ncbi:hypothetical protein B9N43_02975 [Denitratisoma sp. DHT3]|uniref:hypothetical protein n=1 Tax=Denitratisoma sp. DHT3 TaxID=1981880 RepID=UPI00119864CA|nr:hypothetical protein [Denitratisoma sp. DHT3]QDX80315.1 hypothetical protein B9N43_02975 [Denitratisoma sp. DHT3]
MTVPKGTVTAGTGFTFPLPGQILAKTTADTEIKVSLPDGSPLPNWLTFDPVQRSFVSAVVPRGGLPITVVVSFGSSQTFIMVSERTAG